MIQIDRGLAPSFFSSDPYSQLQAELRDHFADYGSYKRQVRYDFRPLMVLQRNIWDEVLHRFANKCAFCESFVDRESKSTNALLDHYRPKQGARGLGETEARVKGAAGFLENHYWWLALAWDNLLVTCPECSRFKAAWFPIADEERRAAEPDQSGPTVDDEEPLLLNPCGDDPADQLQYDEKGTVFGTTEKGRVTIELLNLNRSELMRNRAAALDELRGHFEKAAANIEEVEYYSIQFMADTFERETSPRPYLGIQRFFLDQWLADDSDVGRVVLSAAYSYEEEDYSNWVETQVAGQRSLSTEAGVPPRVLDLRRLVIERIELHNFRNIIDLTLEMPQSVEGGRAPWLVFLGENAVGKSSILQAIVLTLMGDEYREEIPDLSAEDVLRFYREDGVLFQAEEGWVKIWVGGQEEPLQLTFRKGESGFESNVPDPQSYLLAYGATRLLPDRDTKPYLSPGLVRVRNLFRPSTPLIDASEWLFTLYEEDPQRFDLMVRGLRDLLLMAEAETLEPDLAHPLERQILVHLKGEVTTMDRLSDGYRTIVALGCDLMSMLSREGISMTEAEGIVVVDEICSNLHPSWRKRIVDCFRRVFPRIQFIATTHEPLCLRGLYEGEIVLLRRDYENHVVAVTNLPDPRDLRVDELLSSEFFGLSSTLETDLEEIYDEYYRLLIVERPTKAQQDRIEELKGQLQERQHLGNGLRDELMYEVIDKLLARELRSPKPKDRSALKAETLEKVLASWQAAGILDDTTEVS